MGDVEGTYYQQITNEISCLRMILNQAPFLAAIGAAAIAESVTLNVFHIEMEDQAQKPSAGYHQHVTFSRWLSTLRDMRLMPYGITEIQFKLLQEGNLIRHKHYRPNNTQAKSSIDELERVLAYFRSLVLTMPCQCGSRIRVHVSRYLDQAIYTDRPRCPVCKTSLVCTTVDDVRRWRHAE